MDCTSTQLPYEETGFFSSLISAYINGDASLKQFYEHPPSIEGIRKAIQQRIQFKPDRTLLVNELTNQYQSLPQYKAVIENVQLLEKENTFTICTAHQPAIFTGNLFFVYKIVHAIRLASFLNQQIPEHKFVPVFYMGCEDADLDELGHIYLDAEKVEWDTKQKGPIGRMKPAGLEKIISRIEGEYSVLPHGKELIELIKSAYLGSSDIQTATLKLVHALFAEYGLLVMIPDNRSFKKALVSVFEDELLNRRSATIVEKTSSEIAGRFKVQAHPREINLFYLGDNMRQRIEKDGDKWKVVDADITFTREQLIEELHNHPERFSPNVILRGILQETILPNVLFIGGGGEIAYWMQLKNVFNLHAVPFPVLVVRNSFLIVEEKWQEKLAKLRLSVSDIFHDERELLNELVKRQSEKKLSLESEINSFTTYYDRLKSVAGQVDDTLTVHVAALQTRAIKPLHELEKKLLRAEKRKYSVEERHLASLKKALFPNNSLQERVDNFMPYYAKWGKKFIENIHDHSLTLEQQFTVLTCK